MSNHANLSLFFLPRDVAEVITLSQPTTLTAAVLKQPFNDIEAVVAVGGIASVPSLEEVIDQSPGHEDIHELTNLIKVCLCVWDKLN